MEIHTDQQYHALPTEPTEPAEPVAEVGGVDHLLVFSMVSLLCLGAVMVFSATVAADSETLAFNTRAMFRHLAHIGFGLVLLLVAMRLPLEWVQAHARSILLVMLLMLALLFLRTPASVTRPAHLE